MKRVLIIYTGGTIGMTRTENGYAPRAGYFRAALDAIPDLRAPEMPEWEFYELSPLLDSSNMTVREWNCIAELIAQKYDDYDGFVVLHGTDTMAYTASALSFMLDGLDKPVVLTGSQIPLCEIRSDGRDNLITALLIAGKASCVRRACTSAESCCAATARQNTPPTDSSLSFRPTTPALPRRAFPSNITKPPSCRGRKAGSSSRRLTTSPSASSRYFRGFSFRCSRPL